METFYIWCIILTASILVTVSTVMFHFMFLDKIIDYQIGQELALKNGSAAWDRWVNLPVPIYLKVYLFIVTNPEDISNGGKPILKEQGPYVYREVRKKKDININTLKDTITYKQEILFYFDKDNSANYTEDDEVTVINPAIMTIVSTLYNIKPLQFVAKWFDFAIPSMFNSPKSVFLTTTVKKLLFDGEKIKCSHENPNIETLLVCSALRNILPVKVLKLTDNGDLSFALLRHKNGSGMGELEINAGIKKPRQLGQISKWNKLKKLSTWSGDPCNTVGGNEMTLITPYENENSQIKLFSTDICRSVIMEYNKNVIYEDIPGLRFVFSPSFLETPEKYPNNLCYCNTTVKGLTTPSPCLPYGALDISGCLDVPVTLTKPHFMDVDPRYSKGVLGLEPDYQKHLTFLDIEPRTGIPLQGYQRVQFNVLMENISSIEIMEKLPAVLFPLMWIEEGTHLGKKEIDMLKDMIIDKLKIVNMIMWTITLLGILTTTISIIFMLRNTKRKVS